MNNRVLIKAPVSQPKALLGIARRRYRYFGNHGERLDRALYAEIEALIRIWLEFVNIGIMQNDARRFQKLVKIQRRMLKEGQKYRYNQFP